MMKEILETIESTGEAVKDGAKTYFKIFLVVLVISLGTSIISTSLGIYFESRWAIAVGGIIRVIGTWILFSMLAPVAVPLGAIFSENPLERFIARAKGVCYGELLVTLFLLIFLPYLPANTTFMPIFIILALAFYAGGGVIKKGVINTILAAIFVGAVLSLVVPSYFELGIRKITAVDRKVAINKLTPSLEEIDDGAFNYLDSRTEKVVAFYLINPYTKKIEFYDKYGMHGGYGIRTEPVNEIVMRAYRNQLILEEREKRVSVPSSSVRRPEYSASTESSNSASQKSVSASREVSSQSKYKLAIAILEEGAQKILDDSYLKNKLQEKNISSVRLSGSANSLRGLANGNSGGFPNNSQAQYVLVGEVENFASPNNISGMNSSYNSDAKIDYSLFSGDGKLISHSSVKGIGASSDSQRAKVMAFNSALSKLGESVSYQIR